MPKHTLTLAAVALVLAACSGPTDPIARDFAPSLAANHTTPGTPGEANCQGQTKAYLAQYAKNNDLEGARGMGGIARFVGLSVKEYNAVVEEYCAGP